MKKETETTTRQYGKRLSKEKLFAQLDLHTFRFIFVESLRPVMFELLDSFIARYFKALGEIHGLDQLTVKGNEKIGISQVRLILNVPTETVRRIVKAGNFPLPDNPNEMTKKWYWSADRLSEYLLAPVQTPEQPKKGQV